ncbi:MAG TPA: ABC transporter permease [Thermodesulfovibrionales bacterium]|nr:ABC transporter permease [Thermodesulfovibrionales bacterium]
MTARLNIGSFAIKNLKRKIIRTILLLLAVSVVTGTLFTATLFILSMQNALKIGTYRLGADVLVVPEKYASEARSALLAGEPTSFYMERDVLEKVRKVEGVKNASPQLFVKPTSFTCCYNVDVFLIAFDPTTDFTVTPWLEKNLKKTLVGNEIITGREVPVLTGDSIPFFGTLFKVVGTMEPTGMKFFDRSVFMTMDAAYAMAEASVKKSQQPINIERDKISAVLVQVQDGFSPERAAIRIEHDVPGVKAIASDEVISTVRKQLGGLLKGILLISAVLWVLALLMMAFAFSMIVNERQREFGLLRAMGAKKKHVFLLIITEAVTVSVAGGVIGLLTGSAILLTFKNLILHSLKLPYLLPPPAVLGELVFAAILFSLVTGLLASLLPASSASRMEPYEAIRKGE